MRMEGSTVGSGMCEQSSDNRRRSQHNPMGRGGEDAEGTQVVEKAQGQADDGHLTRSRAQRRSSLAAAQRPAQRNKKQQQCSANRLSVKR